MGRNLALLAATVAVLFVLGELGLRISYPPPPIWSEPQVRHLRSPRLGWVLPPGSRSFTIDASVTVNRHGLRDDDFQRKKPAGETRLLCLGDSFTFALGVPFEDLWVQQLERRLRARTKGPVQAINAGVSGYNTRQELLYLLSEGFSFEPDLVVVAFYWNDLVGNEEPLSDLDAPLLAVDEAYREPPSGAHWLPKPLRDALRSSVLVYLGVQGTKRLVALARPPADRYSRVQRALLEGDHRAIEGQWVATAERLRAIAEAAAERGVPVILLVFPMENQIRHEYPDLVFAERLREIWEPTGLPFVDLEPIYRASWAAGDSPFLPYDLHPNQLGMELAAEALESTILDRRLLPLGREAE